MGIEENKEVVRRYWNELNKGNLDYMDECFSDNFINYRIDGTTLDKTGYKQFVAAFFDAFPDLHVTIEDIVAEGDIVAFSFTLTGNMEKEYKGNPPTGKPVSFIEAYFARIENGKITEFRNFQAQIKR